MAIVTIVHKDKWLYSQLGTRFSGSEFRMDGSLSGALSELTALLATVWTFLTLFQIKYHIGL